ncbi:hypothetical protein [Ruminococcus bromii]|uniref:hypothetical protein n=1 Tax=Ruminococcus bromii TaxID=40518 RepID=UPI0039F50F0E
MLQEKYLSVRIDDEGNLKRIFHTDSSAEKLPDTTAVDEVLDFAGIMLQRFLSNTELTDYFQNQYIKNKELKHCVDFDAFNHAVQLVNDYWTRIDICPGFIASDELRQLYSILQVFTSPLINFYITLMRILIWSLMIVLAFSAILIAI